MRRRRCWFTGAAWGFPHPSAPQLREQILRRDSPQTCRLFTSAIISSRTPQQIVGERLDMDQNEQRSKLKEGKEKGKCEASFSRALKAAHC